MIFLRRFSDVFRRMLGRRKPASLLHPLPTDPGEPTVPAEPLSNSPTTPYLASAMNLPSPLPPPPARLTPAAMPRTSSRPESTDPFAPEVTPTLSGDGDAGFLPEVETAPGSPRPPRRAAPPAPPHDPLAEYDIQLKQGPAAGLWFNGGANPPAVAIGTGDLALQRALDVVVREKMNVLDVGAGLGLCTLVAARRCTAGQVFAFEPLADLAALVERSCFLNDFKHVEVHRVALADRDGEARLQLSKRLGHSRLDLAGLPPDPAGVVSVPVATLDSIVSASVCPPPDVLVLDVQGCEAAVLRGGTVALRTGRPIILARLRNTGPAIAKLLEPLGYETFPLGGGEIDTAVTAQHRWVVALARERHHLRLYLPALSHRAIVEMGRAKPL